jgi:hypothetical protein
MGVIVYRWTTDIHAHSGRAIFLFGLPRIKRLKCLFISGKRIKKL